MGSYVSTISSVAMAVGPPLAYADQYYSVVRKNTSEGFSIDVCGILIVANITRVFYWLGARFETVLLIQSLLMILAQFALLYVCLLYKPKTSGNGEEESLTGSGAGEGKVKGRRIGNLWQWESFGSYLEFSALLILFHSLSFLLLHAFKPYITTLGFLALGLEATLPLPQLLVNYKHKSTAGFRKSVLLGWVGGDGFKSVYFFVSEGNSIAFKACALFQLSVDLLILLQTILYRKKTRQDLLDRELGAGVEGEERVSGVEGVAGVEEALEGGILGRK